eukprot:9255815-Pyramimonas_sp.AAC.1
MGIQFEPKNLECSVRAAMFRAAAGSRELGNGTGRFHPLFTGVRDLDVLFLPRFPRWWESSVTSSM